MTSRHESTKSTLLVATVFGALAAWNLYHHRPLAGCAMAAFAAFLAVLGLWVPQGARRFHAAWMKIAAGLGYVNSRILLLLMFVLIIVPFGFILRLLGRDPLLRRGPQRGSYWVPRTASRQNKDAYERIF